MGLVYGAIEGGGTKFVVAVGTGPDNIIARTRIDTRTPDLTIPDCISFIREASEGHALGAIGVACFGPIQLDTEAPDYGSVTNTRSPAGRTRRLLDRFRQHSACLSGSTRT